MKVNPVANKARCRTNEFGEEWTVADTICPEGLHATPIPDFKPVKKHIATAEIYDLSRTFNHGVLANYLLHKYNLYLRKGVKYGSDGKTRWIEVDGITYGESKGTIFDPNEMRNNGQQNRKPKKTS